MKKIVARVFLYSVALVVAYGIYERSHTPIETDEEYCKRTGRIQINDRFFKYDVFENGTMKPITDMLLKKCNGDAWCEVDGSYQYVLEIPYQESNASKTPSDVINTNGGDCDEKSFLLASLLLEKGHPCLMITTKDHIYLAVHVENESQLTSPLAYFIVRNKKYYIAETTITKGYVGQYNNVTKHEINGIFDMVEKKEVPLDQVEYCGIKD